AALVVEPHAARGALTGALEEAVGAGVEPRLRDFEADVQAVATAVAVAIPYGGLDIGADHRPEALRQRRTAGGAIQVAAVVVRHPADLLHAHRVGLVAQQPAQRAFEHVAGNHGVGQRRAGGGWRQRIDPADLADDVRVAAVPGRVRHDPAHHVATVGVGDDNEIGNVLAADEAAQLAGEAAGGAAVPHVLLEIAVDDHVVGAVRQAVADGIDHLRLPVVVV